MSENSGMQPGALSAAHFGGDWCFIGMGIGMGRRAAAAHERGGRYIEVLRIERGKVIALGVRQW